MRTELDALLSVKRYFALVLGWEVRLWSDPGTYRPPMAKVAKSGPSASSRRGRGIADYTMPVQVFMFPDVAIDVSTGWTESLRISEMVFQAIDVGIGEGWPRRIPLYDYAGLTDGQGSNARSYSDFLRVDDLSMNTVPDSDVPEAMIVVADMRVAWSRDTTIDVDHETVESVVVITSAS